MKRRRRIPVLIKGELPSEVRLWILRVLVMLDGHRQFIKMDGVQNFGLASVLGLDDWSEQVEGEFDWKAARQELRQLHKAAERGKRLNGLPPVLENNLSRLSSVIGLSDVDCRILAFVAYLKSDQALEDATDFLGALSSVRVIRSLAIVLGLVESEVRTALGPHGTLARSGLIKLETHGSTLGTKLELLSDDFADEVITLNTDPVDLIRSSVIASAPPHLQIGDYQHVGDALSILRPYLKRSIIDRRKGVNVFFYGKPGTGKTQLAKVLAREIGCQLFEIVCDDREGGSIDGDKRLQALCAAQSFFASRQAFLLFDEVEDVFPDRHSFFERRPVAQQRKAWMNRLLEENSVPTIWISNSKDVDAAFLRRFDFVLEVPIPPQGQREQITRNTCLDLLPESSISRISNSAALAPALITRASSVVESIRQELKECEIAPAVELLISSALLAQGLAPIRKQSSLLKSEVYDPAFVHSDADLEQLKQGLARTKAGRLYLYGPPGTGKTAFAHWLAGQVGMPLVVKRGSDLLSPYVGENERNIAGAFREAEQAQAALLIDEVESFLQDRRTAQRAWEISLVNEMLVQIETFTGIFIATTNVVQGLDPAVLRRFDMKVRFDFLTADQAWLLMNRYCVLLELPLPPKHMKNEIGRLTDLTLGDFAVIDRQRRLNQIDSAEAILSALKTECSFKEGAQTRIGFV